MTQGFCERHGPKHPCTCAMGNVYRFVEPVVLLMLQLKGHAHGYDLAQGLHEHALTDAEIEKAALYRTLRRLEENGYVLSDWSTDGTGPARRVYALTANGERHLKEWAQVLGNLSASMALFVEKTQSLPRRVRTKGQK